MKSQFQAGQTLIETILAVFVLATSLVAGLSLAIYALTASAVSEAQVIGSNLAREGLETVRLMRDSNWLLAEPDPGSVDPTAADDLQSCPDLGGYFCYPLVYDGPFVDLNAASYPTFTDANYRLQYNPVSRTWALESNNNYDLYLQAAGNYSHTANGPPRFARQVKISFLAITDGSCSAPCNNRIIKALSIVAWRGRNCAEFTGTADLETLTTSCKVVMEEHLTNWKDYK